MFGYVVVNKPELKIKEYDVYKEYYCGLCHGLKKYHGSMSRLGLNYDYTFLLMLLTGLYEPKESTEGRRCIVHPVKKQKVRNNEFVEYVADMGIILSYFKCEDDWKDDKNLLKKTYGTLISSSYKRMKDKYPEKVEVIRQCIMDISEAENDSEDNIDIIAGYFGRAFGELCAVYKDEWEMSLRKMGFFLGKFIYIMDAYEDILEDVKKGRYNPFKDRYKDEDFDESVREMLIINGAECAREFEKLPIVKDVEILRNILYSGIWTRYATICDRRKTNEKSV